MDYLELPGWIFTFDWESVLDTYGNLSPLVPILVVMAESFLPAVPLYIKASDGAAEAEQKVIEDIGNLFAMRMKAYMDGCKEAGVEV